MGLHLSFGWWSLLVFLTLGIVLESLHGFKVRFYLEATNETRRLMWTLAHAHGTLLALVNIAFATTLQARPGWTGRWRTIASRFLIASAILLPAGFFLGGTVTWAGDPNPTIALVPLGALLMLVAVFLTARELSHRPRTGKP